MQNNTIIIFVALAFMITSCNNNEKVIELNKKILKQAYKNNDVNTALMAANTLYASDTQNVAYCDTLAILYYSIGNFGAAYNLALKNPDTTNNLKITSLLAYSAEKSKKYQDAVFHFQDLTKLDPKNAFMYNYQIGFCFFSINNFESCIDYMNKVVNDPSATNNYLEIDNQQVPYQAAAYNSIGFCEYKKGNLEKSKQIFEAILKRYPNFKLAQNNYGLLTKK